MPRIQRLAVPSALALLLGPGLAAQDPPPAATRATEVVQLRVLEAGPGAGARRHGEPFELKAGRHDLAELVQRAAAWLGRNYLFSETEFAGGSPPTIELQTPLHLDARGLEIALGQFLWSKGFAAVQVSGELQLYAVISLNGPRRGEVAAQARFVEPDAALEAADRLEYVLTAVRLEHLNAMTASTTIRPFFAQSSSPHGSLIVGSAGDEQSVLLSGFTPQVAAAVRLLRIADAAAGDAKARARLAELERRVQQLESATAK